MFVRITKVHHGRPQGRARVALALLAGQKIMFLTFLEKNSTFLGVF